MKYARVENGIVVEIFVVPNGVTIFQCFHPDLVAQFEPVSDEVQAGWLKNEDGSFTEPTV